MSSVVSPLIEIHFPLAGVVDVGAEIVKMEKSHYAVLSKVRKLRELISGDSYAKVPEATKKKNDEQLSNDSLEAEKILAGIDNFKSVLTPEQHAQYLKDKVIVYQTDREKAIKSIEKLRAALPVEVDKQPKKSLAKIAEAEQDLKDIETQIAGLLVQ
jgi:hypothetical protein